MLTPIIYGTVNANSGVTLMARLRGNDGQVVTQASLSTITWTITNITTGAAVGTGTFSISGTVFDTLQQSDSRWTRDSSGHPGIDGQYGYSFLATLAASNFPSSAQTPAGVAAPDTLYQIDVKFTPVTGQPFTVIFQVTDTKTFNA